MAEQALKGTRSSADRLSIPELARRARLRKLIALGVVLIAAGAAVAYYRRPEPVVERYRTEPVVRRDVVQLIESTGTLDVRSRVEVPAPMAGRLLSNEVHEGDHVEQGQLLGTLDARSAELSLRGARATAEAASGRVAQAQVALDAAARARSQAARLLPQGLASPQDVEQADSELASAKAALTAARAERKLADQTIAGAELGRDGSRITAPSAGVVLRAPDRIGAAVSPERALYVLGEPLLVMRLQALVSETDIPRVKPGSKAEVLVQALPGERFDATVERVGIEPKQTSGVVQYPVTMLVDNPKNALLPGMSARVRIEIARASAALAVHEAALRFIPEDAESGEARARVWRHGRDANEIEPVDVRVGVSDGVYAALLVSDGAASGGDGAGAALAEGDRLVIGLLRPDEARRKPSVSLGGSKK
ncbi:MAG TPA: efflux RND transporter periplasmic adaptor subunit [Polyangiales bacterium]|nr:efflux RND transporter periplasmic adaptor subunit [Polyangiales bacterium]